MKMKKIGPTGRALSSKVFVQLWDFHRQEICISSDFKEGIDPNGQLLAIRGVGPSRPIFSTPFLNLFHFNCCQRRSYRRNLHIHHSSLVTTHLLQLSSKLCDRWCTTTVSWRSCSQWAARSHNTWRHHVARWTNEHAAWVRQWDRVQVWFGCGPPVGHHV